MRRVFVCLSLLALLTGGETARAAPPAGAAKANAKSKPPARATPITESAEFLSEPADRQNFKSALSVTGISFRWVAPEDVDHYFIEIRDRRGMTFRKTLKKGEFQWIPLSAGAYQWRAGFSSDAAGEVWSGLRAFTVQQKALNSIRAPASANTSRETLDDNPLKKRPSEWYLVAHFSQAVIAYTVEEQDLQLSAGGAALVGLAGLEGRWRGPKGPSQAWTMSAAANLDVLRQTVLGNDFLMPRGWIRLYTGLEENNFRQGPFLQLHAGKAGVFIVEDQVQARKAEVFRYGAGLGGTVVYRPAPAVGLSMLGMLRVDLGGSDPVLPNALLWSPGYELGFGMSYQFSQRLVLEGRLRGVQENFRWKPADTTQTESSSMNNTFIMMDFGLGVRF